MDAIQPQQIPSSGRPSRLPMIIIIVLMIVVAGAGIWWILQKKQTAPSTTTNQNTNTSDTGGMYQKNVKFPPQPPEEDEVFSYTGRIERIESDGTLLVLATDRGVKNVEVSSTTATVRQIKPSPAERETLTGEQIAARLAQEFPAARSIQTGDTVTVISETNIQGKERFAASKIIIIE